MSGVDNDDHEDLGSLGQEEDAYRLRAEENARTQIAEEARNEAQKVQLMKFLSRYTREFEVERPNIGNVRFLVNLKSGQVLASKESDKKWSRLEAKYALRWLRAESLQAFSPGEHRR